MKTLLKSGFALALGLLLHGSAAQAQVQVNVNVPVWGPAVPPNVQYYYIPEIDGYYDLYSGQYLFFDPYYNSWVSSPRLPRMYAGYDPRFFHPVVIQYVGRQPWGYLRDHRRYCDQWGVRPGRYYGANWPGRGYYASPRGGYGPAPGYYNAPRPYGQGGYAQHNGYYDRDDHHGRYDRDDYRGRDNRYDRDDRNDRDDYRGRDNRYDQNENRPGQYGTPANPGPGNYPARPDQGTPGNGGQPQPGGWNNGGGRHGRVL